MNFEEISDPLAAVDTFRRQAEESGQSIPEAMTLATVGLDGRPKARVVLLKERRERSLQFFSNYLSDKAKELEANPNAALCMHFSSLQLQARIEGLVERLSAEESDAYFATRPRESQVGAWASLQSQPLKSRAELDAAFDRETVRFREKPVPRPPHWGGFSLQAETVELWVGQGGRLHDRARYQFDGNSWSCMRLYP